MKFFEKRFAEEYEARLKREGYPGSLWDEVRQEIRGIRTVIDVGAGTGFFSLPLAETGCQVTAVEPSPEMIRIFRKKIPRTLESLIEIAAVSWEDWRGCKAEGLICVHAIYGMDDVKAALLKMRENAGTVVLVIKSEGRKSTLSEIIRHEMGIVRVSGSFRDKVVRALQGMGQPVSIRMTNQTRLSRMDDLDVEADYYCYHLGLEGSDHQRVKEIIQGVVLTDSEGFYFQEIYHDEIIVLR